MVQSPKDMPKEENNTMEFPFQQQTQDNKLIRTFTTDVEDLDLVWHQDNKDRLVEIIEPGGWSFQMENELPNKLERGQKFFIPKLVWHRVIKGESEMVVSIEEFD